MGDSTSHHQQTSSSRLGLRNSAAGGGGEIVEVQGGHIIRSTGRKDRHSKVCTFKGPRDRRVRLAAHTAIQFYDVQDRLGYDRPSKAVDWLINKAKAAIDELDQLPAWHPTDCSSANPNFRPDVSKKHEIQPDLGISDKIRGNAVLDDEQRGFHPNSNSSFLPPSLDSDAIADTIKSFFPITASSSLAMEFDNFPTPDLLSRNVASSQDLRLSLQSFADPILLHHHQNPNPTNQQTPILLTTGTSLGFDGTSSGWAAAEHHHQRRAAWNSGGDAAGCYFFNPPAPQLLVQHSHNQFCSQRGPLQSSNTPSVRAWMDPSVIANHHYNHPSLVPMYHPPPISGSEGGGGCSGFHIPARIQGEEEEHDGYSDKPSSASSDSHH